MTRKELEQLKGQIRYFQIMDEVHACLCGTCGETFLCVQDLATERANAFPLDEIEKYLLTRPLKHFKRSKGQT